VICLPNFKSSTIDKYDGSTNPAEWLEVYQLVIEAAGGDLYNMAKYLSIYLSSSARTCLIRLPIDSVRSWSDLCKQFINNIRATCERPRVKWDLANIMQKDGTSIQDFIQCLCIQRNVILEGGHEEP
jgi:hypothetical protein